MSNPTNSELKACPFCGSQPYFSHAENGLWQIRCGNLDDCLAGVTWGHFATRAEAISAWNARKSEALADDAIAQVLAHVAGGGPHEWGYRDPVTGDFIADDWPFKAADALAALTPSSAVDLLQEARAFQIGDRVSKKSGSSWTGRVVGFYSTALTPEGYAVESENEPGSVQIYPCAALKGEAQ